MRAPIPEILLVALAQLPAFSFGVPLGDISTVYAHRSSQSSNNKAAPITLATLLTHPSNPTTISARSGDPPPVAVHVPNTGVYIMLTVGIRLAGDTIQELIEDATLRVLNIVLRQQDGDTNTLLPNGMFNYEGANSASIQVWNANNHQTTYGVLGVALTALHDWMGENGYTLASFGIYDGDNQVGNGVITGVAS